MNSEGGTGSQYGLDTSILVNESRGETQDIG